MLIDGALYLDMGVVRRTRAGEGDCHAMELPDRIWRPLFEALSFRVCAMHASCFMQDYQRTRTIVQWDNGAIGLVNRWPLRITRGSQLFVKFSYVSVVNQRA